jgi:SAM-dependent methyltransferase
MSHVSTDHYAAADYFPDDLEGPRRREARWNARRVEKLRQLLPDASARRALDFGCGAGGFLRHAQGLFGELVGYDLSARVCAAHRAAGWRAVDSLDAVPADVDTIVLFHVLEHLPDPWELLASLAARFPAVDRVVVETPNTDEVLNALFHSEPYRRNHFSADHVYYFTSATLRRVAERGGLRVLVDDQLQRYTVGNTLGWLADGRGGGQDRWSFFDDAALNEAYERVLVEQRIADSLFLVCTPEGRS